ncbi:uncharacterized protein LOC129965357 [Argiope bruennichi]|uniref:uncharacterized protein LOC129965357 n=1 Tax=Argiope bruennichi TaxID=94029 RepID=UPI00249480C4|nr:uncharacterized protein LOC129965357 [Argiope bruennichi]
MAHGLVLRMQDMMQDYRRNDKTSSEQGTAFAECNANPSNADMNIPKLWANAVEFPKNSKKEYFTLLRRTLLFMFSSKWSMYTDKGDLLCAFKYHYRAFSTITENVAEVFKAVLEIFKRDPWKNSFFSWNDLFDGTVTVYDRRVQDYFESEPEEVVLARVHALVFRKRANDAMCLAKTSFLYHSRIAKNFRPSRRRNSTSDVSTSGHASIDWFLFILLKTKSLDFIVNEARQLECHEGVEIVCRLWRDPKNKKISYMLLQIFLLQDLLKTSKYCCTRKLYKLFCLMHEELHSSPKEIAESCYKLFSKYAPSSAHFYLLVDILWGQFGMKCLDLYVDLFVRGLTADINHLENKRHLEAFLDAASLEDHISVIFEKLSTLFKNVNLTVARECMFSAFSLRPTKERLFILQRLSQSLSNSNKDIHKSLLDFDFSADCNCGLRCIGHCRDFLNKSSFIHPLLSNSIGNISLVLKRDFISVLESVRCITFQYNIFDWRYNIGDLTNYFSTFAPEKTTLKKSGSDTESGDEIYGSSIANTEAVFNTANDMRCQFDHSSIKRKSGSNEFNPLNIGGNTVVQNDDFASKRMKTEKPNMEMSVSISSNNQQVIQGIFNNSLENVIRMSLNTSTAKRWPDSMNLLQINEDPVINDLNPSKISRKPESSLQSCFSDRNAFNSQRCNDSKDNVSLHYSDKPHLQISASLSYDRTQQHVTLTSEDNTPYREMDSSDHQLILKSHLVQNSSAKVSSVSVTEPTSETFYSSISSPKPERRSHKETNTLHFAAKSERERPMHNHHLHSSPFVSSQPPPKSFSKHHSKIHSFIEEKAQSVATLASQESRESVPFDNTRKSVIVKGKSLQIPNQLSVPMKPNAVHQNRNNVQTDSSALPLLHVNVPHKYLAKPEVPANANLIPYKHDNPAPSISQISANDSNVELVALSGIAPPSMIKSSSWKTATQNNVKTSIAAKMSDSTSTSSLSKVSSKYCKQLLQSKSGSDLILNRNTSNESEYGVIKPKKGFEEITKNNLQHAVANKRIAYSNSQGLNNSLDSKVKWTLGQARESPQRQTTFHPISDNRSALKTTNSQPLYASPHPKTSSNSPISFPVHLMNASKTSSNSPVSFSVNKMDTSKISSNSPVSFSVQKMNSVKTSSNSPVSFSAHKMDTSKTSSNSPVSFSVQKMNSAKANSNNSVSFSAQNLTIPKTNSSSPVSLSVQNMASPKTNSNSPVSISVQNKKILKSFGDKVSTYTDANNHNHSSINNVQNKPSISFLKSRLTSVHTTQSYSHMNAYSNFSTQNKGYSEHHEPSRKEFDVKNVFERSAPSFITPPNIATNSIPSSQVQSNPVSVYNSVYPANDRRAIVHEARNIATSSPSSNVQNTNSSAFSQPCCSAFEVNPCDTCSTKTNNQEFLTKTEVVGFRSSPVENLNLLNQVTDGISPDDNCFEVSKKMQQQTETEEPQKMCNFCSFSFPASLIKTHVESIHRDELFNDTNYNIQNQILNKETSFSVSETININYDSQNENRMSLDNNIHNDCNNVLDIENSQNTDQFISSLLDFIDPNFDKSIEGSFENTGISHPINTSESPCNNSKSQSLSDMLKDVDFSRNISSDLSAICEGNELSYDMTDDKQLYMENLSNENRDIKSWYSNLSLDLLSNDKPEKDMTNFKEYKPEKSETSSFQPSNITNNESVTVDKQISEKLKGSYEIFKTVKPLEQSNHMSNLQDLDEIGTFQNISSQQQKSALICPICKRKVDIDLQQHINIYHPHISGDKMVYNDLESPNDSETDKRNEAGLIFTPYNSDALVNSTEIFDFDSYSPDNVSKEVYRPLQKGKTKLHSNSSCNRENNMNIPPKLDTQVTEYETPTSKKKGPREICIFCAKVYSKNYIRTHYRKEHLKDQSGDHVKMSENLSNQSLPGQVTISSPTPEKNQDFTAAILQEDIDTNTCLSTSDALNSSNKCEGSNIKKSSCNSSNRIVQQEQKYPFLSVSDGVKESSAGSLNFEVLENPTVTALKEKGFNSRLRNAFNQKPKTTTKYQCSWFENENSCKQNFPSKLLLVKHLRTEHLLKFKCRWSENNNYCYQCFTSEAALLKHMQIEHGVKNVSEYKAENIPAFERNRQMEENNSFCNSSNNKKSAFVQEEMQVSVSKSDLTSLNLNHNFEKIENDMNSLKQFNSDKDISLSQIKCALPTNQTCPEDLDQQDKNDKCHLSTKSVLRLSRYKCRWFHNDGYCNQNFPTKSSLIKHLNNEHLINKSSEYENQPSETQKNALTLESSELIEENNLFCNSSNNKESVFEQEVQGPQVSKSKSGLPPLNLNQFNSDKDISFSQTNHVLPSDQICSGNFNNPLCFEVPEKNKCNLSPKSVCHLFNNTSVDEYDIVSTEKMLSKKSHASSSVSESFKKSFKKSELPDLLNSFKTDSHEVNANNLPQKIYERYDTFSFVSNAKKSPQNDRDLVQNSISNEDPSSVSYDFVTKIIDPGASLLSLSGNSNNSSKTDCLISDLLQDFDEMNKLSARNKTSKNKGNNKYEKSRPDSVCESNGDEKHNKEVFKDDESLKPNKSLCSISSEKLFNQSSVKKHIKICHSTLLKNEQLNFERELSLPISDTLKCHASSNELYSSISVASKEVVITSDCPSPNQQDLQDNYKSLVSVPYFNSNQKQINSIPFNGVSSAKSNSHCNKKSKRKASSELSFVKPVDNCTRLIDMEMQLSSSPSENSNNQNAQYPISVQDYQNIKNGHNSMVNYCEEIIQSNSELNLTRIARVADESSLTVLPKSIQFDATSPNSRVNNSQTCTNNFIKLKPNLDSQTQLSEAYDVHKSVVSTKSVVDEKQSIENNESTLSVTKRPDIDKKQCFKNDESVSLLTKRIDSGSNSSPNVSESDEKDMPNLVPEYDFQSLLVTEKFKTDEDVQSSEIDLERSDFYCFPYHNLTTSDVSCPTDNVVTVSSAGAHIVDNQEPFSFSSNTSCTYPDVLTDKDSKINENLSFLNEDSSALSSVDTFKDLSLSEECLIESVMKSKSNNLSIEHFNDSSFNQKEIYVSKSEVVNSSPAKDFGQNFISSGKDGTESYGELVKAAICSQLSKKKQLKKSLLLSNDEDSLKGNTEDKLGISISQKQPSFQLEIEQTVNDMLTFINSCENSSLNFENGRSKCDKSTISSISEVKASPYSVNSDGSKKNLTMPELCERKEIAILDEISDQFGTSNIKNSENFPKSCILCKEVCHSEETLSSHLKLIHNVPHLKEQISKFREDSNVDKLSPPPLYLHSAFDCDSASASAESSPNKYSEEDNSISYKDAALDVPSSTEPKSSLSELSSNIEQKQLKTSQSTESSCMTSQISSDFKFKKRANIIKRKRNKIVPSLCSYEKKSKRNFPNKKLRSFNAISNILDKDLICKNAALPKCIIKVLKDEQNSVFYKIDNSPDVIYEGSVQAGRNSFNSMKYADLNTNVIDHQSGKSSVKCKQVKKVTKCTKRSFHPPSLDSSFNLLEKDKELLKETNNNMLLLLNDKKRNEQNNYAFLTLKPKDIKQFLIDNKQPYVLLTRLNSPLNSFNVSTLKPDFSYVNFICKKPVVRLKRLKTSDIEKGHFRMPEISVLLKRIPNNVEEKTFESSSELTNCKKCCVVKNEVS